jgi:hypothetical protein
MVDPIELRLGAPDDAEVTELAIQIAKRDLGVVAGERAARALAARAQLNPLYLTELIKLARVNGLRLMDDDIPEIQNLPGDAHSLFQREWADYLSVGTRHLLTAAAIVGTPVHETVALAAANALPHSGKVQRLGEDPVSDGLKVQWIAAEQDPYSSDRTLRFAEPILRDVAAGEAEVLTPRNRSMVAAAAVRAVTELPEGTSRAARGAALELGLRLLEQVPADVRELAGPVLICTGALNGRARASACPP